MRRWRSKAPAPAVIATAKGDRSGSTDAAGGDAALVEELRAALAPDRVHVGGLELALYGRDASLERGDAAVVCFPTSTEEVQACVRLARRHGRRARRTHACTSSVDVGKHTTAASPRSREASRP